MQARKYNTPEELHEAQKRWRHDHYIKHRAKCSSYHKTYYQQHREEIFAKRRENYQRKKLERWNDVTAAVNVIQSKTCGQTQST